MSDEQVDTHLCLCGQRGPVTATDSPYRFDWRCACGLAGRIAWAHARPAPLFRVSQPTLFEAVGEEATV